jgi:hypothetical protein
VPGAGFTGRVNRVKRIARLAALDPRQAVERAWETLRERRDRPAPAVQGVPSPLWEQQLHELLRTPWPCADSAAVAPLWRDIRETLRRGGLQAGRGAYGGWDDGDPALVRAAWCITAHLRPQRVVETGVARGITSRTILEGLARNGQGRLWSIDLPAPHHPDLKGQLGFVVAPELRGSWTLIEGSSRRELTGLLERLGSVDLFVHDSLHSERNIRFELECVWPFVRSGGAVLVDDVHRNAGFYVWLQQACDAHSIVCLPDDAGALFAIVVKRSS